MPTTRSKTAASAATLLPLAIGLAMNGAGKLHNEQPQAPGPAMSVTRTASFAAKTKTKGCVQALSQCPANGCADPQQQPEHAVFNEAKRHIPDTSTDPIQLTVPADFETLEQVAEEMVGSGGEIGSRAPLVNITQIGHKSVGEGSFVRVFGFLVTDPLGPHPNTGESVNCNLHGEANNDIHIPLAASADDTDYQGIVVEMIPQGRTDPGWNSATLARVAKQKLEVWVEGQLFYDNEHLVNNDADDPKSGQPARTSLWEVHPITTFLVCASGTNCSHSNKQEWSDLSKFATHDH
jgi:hypothetical protein